MGSYDMACAVSGLSLGRGQKVKLLFISENRFLSNGAGSFDPSDYGWDFCSFPFDAEYSDYGLYDWDKNDDNWKMFVNFLAQNGVKNISPKLVSPNENVRITTTKTGIEHIDLLTKDFLTIKAFAIHADVYDFMLRPRKDSYYGVINLETIVKEERSIYEERQELFKTIEKENPAAAQLIIKSVYVSHREYVNKEFLKYVSNNFDTHYWHEIGEIDMIYRCMMLNRIPMHPNMSAGQDWNWDESRDFHKTVAKIADRLHKEAEEDDDD